MPKSKRDWAAVVEDVIKHDKKNPPKRKKKAKPKPAAKDTPSKAGRKSTVDYERPGKLYVSMKQDTFDRLDQALLTERQKRRPEKVDKGMLVEEAIEAWLRKSKY